MTKTAAVTRIVNTRDAAASILRKMGIKKDRYNNFIKKFGDTYEVNVLAAQKSLKPAKKAPKAEKTVTKKVGIGALVKQILTDKPDMPYADVVTKVLAKFPESNVNVKCVAWYKHQLQSAK